ncbi:putative pilus assembly domain protein [Bordetella holmesii 70147]|nr:putative pilus assembly domain protein [Bordetella holmesii 70147]
MHGPLVAADTIVIGPCRLRLSPPPPTPADVAAGSVQIDDASETWQACRAALHEALIQALDLRRRDVASMSDGARGLWLVGQIAERECVAVPETVDRVSLCKSVLDEAVGLGALEPLLEDSSISEIMVNVTCSP